MALARLRVQHHRPAAHTALREAAQEGPELQAQPQKLGFGAQPRSPSAFVEPLPGGAGDTPLP